MKPPPDSQTAVPVVVGAFAPVPGIAAPVPHRLLPPAALRLLSDERLARLAAAGDRTAFEAIFSRYHQPLYRYCLSVLRDPHDAADALQSAMLRALHALEGEQREIALRPWLYRIAYNESISVLRRAAARRSDEHDVSERLGVDDHADMHARLDELLGDLRELPERQRGAIAMRELAGLEYDEIAAALDTSPAAAKQAIYEARQALHELAKGRAMACESVRSAISDGDRRSLRGRALRAHLRACADCRAFQEAIDARRATFASFTPALPAAGSARLLETLFAGGSGAGAGGAGAGGAGVVATAAAAKALGVLVVAVTVGVGVGALTATNGGAASHRPVVAPSVASSRAPHAGATKPSRHRHAAAPRHRAAARRHATARRGAAGGARRTAAGATHASAPSDGAPRLAHSQVATGSEQGYATPSAPQSSGPVRQLLPHPEGAGPVRHIVQSVRNTAQTAVGHVGQATGVAAPAVPPAQVPHLPLRPKYRRALAKGHAHGRH